MRNCDGRAERGEEEGRRRTEKEEGLPADSSTAGSATEIKRGKRKEGREGGREGGGEDR
jgi:hypothetical protein